MYNKGPFAVWVPKPVQLLLILVFLFPLMSVMGVYTGNATEIASGLATYAEFISLANNANTIGMGLGILIGMRIKMRFRSKEIVVGGCIILALLSYICGTTENPIILVIGSLLIGFIKMFPATEMILPIMFLLSPNGDRGKFYAVFYPLSMCVGQVSGYYMAGFVFEGNYQVPYFVMSAIMLIVALIAMIFQHNQRFCFKMPLYQVDWLSMLLLGGSAMSFNYFFVFLKQQAWFASTSIQFVLLIGILLFGLTIYRQKFLKRKMFDFKLFITRPNLYHSIILLLFFGIYNATTSIYAQYAGGILGYNSLVNAQVTLWIVPGIIMSGIIAFVYFKNNWHIKHYILIGFLCFFIHTLMLYFIIQPQMDIRYLEYSMIFKGIGIGMLFIGIWYYGLVGLTIDNMMSAMSILIMVRTFFAGSMGSAIVSWALYQGQWQSLNDISMYLDSTTIQNGMSIYQSINVNAIISSAKIVLGSLCWLIIPVTIFILTHHYGRFNYRRIILFRKVIKGCSLRGYKFF